VSVINDLIDAQMKCVKCGAPGVHTCDCYICQRCTGCGRVRWYAREATDPPAARELHWQCPDCNPLGSGSPLYFDRQGRLIPYDDDSKWPSDEAVAWAMAIAREREQ
jgi:hypothetical protein